MDGDLYFVFVPLLQCISHHFTCFGTIRIGSVGWIDGCCRSNYNGAGDYFSYFIFILMIILLSVHARKLYSYQTFPGVAIFQFLWYFEPLTVSANPLF